MIRNILLIIKLLLAQHIYAQNKQIETSGDILQIALPVAAFSSTLIWKDDTKPIIQFMKTMSASVIVTHGLKRVIDKERPNGGKYSFPSGHTSCAFTGAAFINKRYGWEIGIPAYILAGYVGWTRVYANKHDYWDVLGGAAIGILSAELFTKKYQKNNLKLSLNKFNNIYLLLNLIL